MTCVALLAIATAASSETTVHRRTFDDKCADRARVGECDKNPTYMQAYCKVECARVGNPPTVGRQRGGLLSVVSFYRTETAAAQKAKEAAELEATGNFFTKGLIGLVIDVIWFALRLDALTSRWNVPKPWAFVIIELTDARFIQRLQPFVDWLKTEAASHDLYHLKTNTTKLLLVTLGVIGLTGIIILTALSLALAIVKLAKWLARELW